MIPRSVATQGLGYGPLGVATQGFVTGIFVQLGGFGQVVAFGIPTIGIGSPPLVIEPPSLLTIVRLTAPTISGGLQTVERLFVKLSSALFRTLTRGAWKE